LSFFRKNV